MAPPVEHRSRWIVAWSFGVVALAGMAWFASGLAPFTRNASIATLGTGVVVLALSTVVARRSARAEAGRRTTRQPEPPGSLAHVGLVAWIGVAALGLAVELVELLRSPRRLHPTLSALLDEVAGPGHRIGRAVAFGCWAAVGWWIGRLGARSSETPVQPGVDDA